jgi:CRP/FNR family transcriptional regulator, cyclic AMP receptor protein
VAAAKPFDENLSPRHGKEIAMEIQPRTLAEHPFFSGLSEPLLELIAPLATSERFEDGEYILREGQDADEFYLIQSGQVALEIYTPANGVLTVETIGAGEALGWSWMIPPHQWRFDARAIGMTRAVMIDGKRLRAACEENHDLKNELLIRVTQLIAHRLHATRSQLMGIHATHA